jgi:hypothetical protein
MWVHGASFVNVQKPYCHIEQLVQWFDLILKGLARWITSLSHHLIAQTRTNLWTLLHLMKYCKPTIWISMHIAQCDPWQRNHILMLDLFFLSKCFKVALNFSINTSKSLNKGDQCSNKGTNQARVVLDNEVPMNPTWVGVVGYQWGWSQMTERTWLTKPWNFEHLPSNLLGRLICGPFGWACVFGMHPKDVKTWLVCKWTIDSRVAWFPYSIFLRTTKNFSMDVDMITNIMKYDTNKRWVIHNLSQQEVGNLWLFEIFSFEEER